jgi:hypothetical protein
LPLHTFYTSAEKGQLSRTEMAAEEVKVGIYVRDRWNNCSDTLVKYIQPLFLERLPNTTWENAKLPTDSWQAAENNNAAHRLENLWDGVELAWYPPGAWVSDYGSPLPQHFTIKLGYKAVINRLQIWPRGQLEIYSGGAPRIFELWGTDNPPSDGSWNNWTLMGRWEVYKPSGYKADGSVGVITADDITHWRNSQIYDVEPTETILDPNIPVSYVRFRTIDLFSSYGTSTTSGAVLFGELALLGQKLD